ncbi:MAG: beta-mannosidase [Lentimonas sp.]
MELFENNKIINKQIKIEEITETKAVVNYKLSLSHKPTGELFLKSLFFNERILLDEITSSTSFAIKDPILWWPRGYGEAYMYDDTLQLLDETGVVLQVIPISFGVRSSELRQVKDSIGTSYEIWVNGQYVFCKGANYIPHEVEISKINKENTIAILKTAKDANMNMIRVWGGGYYPADYFYDYCDENGIMIWQDFMFACAMYPDYKEYLSTVEEEFDYQIPRISSHASVVLFNGNNEVDIAWNNWGFQIQYALVRRKQKRIQHAYDHLFREVLADKVADISKIPYIHTSPLSNWGKDELYNHGSQHYWGVWHGRDPIEDFGKKSGRFNAEYGFQSFPQLSTINKYATEEEKDLKNEVMKNHQKSYVGNGMIKKQNEILYGKSKDFDEFVYHSQLTQAKAVGIAIAAHRLKAPICSGTIYWQLNDCWPASTWSSIDYFNNWKALHYQAKNDYESVAVVEKIEELNKETYFLISDFPQSTKVSIKCSVYDLRGNSIISKSASYDLSFLDKIDLSSEFKLNTYKNENFLVQFEWVQNDRIQTRKFTHLSGERPKVKPDEYEIEVVRTPGLSAGTLTFKNKLFMQNVFFQSENGGIHFKENFESYLPGTHTINFTLDPNVKTGSVFLQHL